MKKWLLFGILLVVGGVVFVLYLFRGGYKSEIERTNVELIDSSESSDNSLADLNGVFYGSAPDNNVELLFHVDGLKNTTGAFEVFEVQLEVNEPIDESVLNVRIQSKSLTTENPSRDKHLREEDFFNVEAFPEIVFRSNVLQRQKDQYLSQGMLSFLGKEQDIDVPFRYLGQGKDSDGQEIFAFEGTFEFDRTQYGMESSDGIGDWVRIEFYCELLKKES